MKFALMTSEEKVDEIAAELNKVVDESLSVVTSGHGCIDLIVSGVHKGHALDKLMEIWDIQPEEVMAFGDARNDLEMLKKAKYGFVMANGTEFMKQEIGRVAPLSNEEDGELAIIEEYFANPEAFLEKYA
jgi:hydroxymethylpyrimidine pyrophosphatase-like HAD family hydrolase